MGGHRLCVIFIFMKDQTHLEMRHLVDIDSPLLLRQCRWWYVLTSSLNLISVTLMIQQHVLESPVSLDLLLGVSGRLTCELFVDNVLTDCCSGRCRK